jgi:hypothetical protein
MFKHRVPLFVRRRGRDLLPSGLRIRPLRHQRAMTGGDHRIKTTLALALTLGAIGPAAAQARPQPTAGPPAGDTPQVIVSSAPRGFDWGDAGIGAAAGLGLSMAAVGGGLFVVGRRRPRRYVTAR